MVGVNAVCGFRRGLSQQSGRHAARFSTSEAVYKLKSIWVTEVSDYGENTGESQGALIYRTAPFGPEQSLYSELHKSQIITDGHKHWLITHPYYLIVPRPVNT